MRASDSWAAVTAALLCLLAGCGDRTNVVIYQPGKYQGKMDSLPWNNALFAGDKAKWESTLKARNLRQDESHRNGS